ncbi:MAG: acyltransferase [Calditrichaeota bacterium]|nr:acyltransferase [Calditrichota bacterium]
MKTRIKKLDGLRGIFSLMVVLYHYNSEYDAFNITTNFFVSWSNLFVDFFFVLSGLVISLNYYDKIIDLAAFKEYLIKRFIRLYPLLLFTVLTFFVFKIVGNYFFNRMLQEGVTKFSNLILSTFDPLLFTNSTPLLGSGSGMNTPTWSISSEMISYIVFGIIAVSSRNRTLLSIVLFILCIFFLVNTNQFIYVGDYGFIRGLAGFISGFFVYIFSKKNLKLNNGVELLLPIGLVLLFYTIEQNTTYRQLYLIATIPSFFSLILLVLLKTNGLLSKLLMSKICQFLGKISYSIYLTHFLILKIMPLFFFKFLKINQTTLNCFVVFILTIVFVVCYSTATYFLIEVKGKYYLRRKIISYGLLSSKKI